MTPKRISSSLVSLASRKAALVRFHGPDDPRTIEAAIELKVAKIGALIAEDPPLPEADREKLARMLLPGWAIWTPITDADKARLERVLS